MDEKPEFYYIRIEGHLDHSWSEWLDGLTFTHLANGETLLSGYLADQTALYGLLNKIRDMNLPLLSVERAG